MTAYPAGGPPGVLARFPTVFTAGSPPYGPLHRNQKLTYYLGPAITLEKEADIGFDADGVNNLKPPSDAPDLDRADDGVPLAPLPHCAPIVFTYTVTVMPGAPASKAFVNLWFDWDRSGDWGAVLPCQGVAAPEWAVQNQVLALIAPGTYTFTTPVFLPYNPAPDRCLWWRITLSSQPATAADGSGPANAYEFGETEDYYQCGDTPSTPTPTMTSTPTPTATLTATPTSTPTATPTQKPVLTGISSTFYVTSDGFVVITVHVQDPALTGLIYDMEIFFNEQTPPWPGGQPVHGPQGWEPFPVPGGIGWVTSSNPLVACQPVQFVVQLPPGVAIGDVIWLHMTDKEHKNLGYVVSQRSAPGAVSVWPAFWAPPRLDPDCVAGLPATMDGK
jgi:hypothetical protein